jgi:Asp-tRNA(Asn)/Glu-tRNA(Gln) amidotransferase A subunit family amidase
MTATRPSELTASQGVRAMRAGDLTPTALLEDCIARVDELEASVSAWARFEPEAARRDAARLDEELAAGTHTGRLPGIPVGVKDVFNTADLGTEMGSQIWRGFTPGNDARVVVHLRWQGAVVPGKTVTAEFAVHHPGPTRNPYSSDHSPGTSSSGSAAAVASRMVPLALGTQTAGSTIRPSSYCGIYGFKPSFGVIPRTGILKTLDTLDHVSLMSRSIEDLRLMFDCCRVEGPNHPHVHNHIDGWAPERLSMPLRVALVRGPVWDRAQSYAQKELLELAHQWAADPDEQLDEVTLPEEFMEGHDLHELIYSKALSYYFSREYTEHPELVSDQFREMVERGRQVSAGAYQDGLARQRRLGHALDQVFDRHDVILNLSTSGVAPEGLDGRDGKDCCLIWTLCHAPAMSLPVFTGPGGLPFGAQLVARRYGDPALLWIAETLQAKGLVCEWTPPAPSE